LISRFASTALDKQMTPLLVVHEFDLARKALLLGPNALD
jgi:hypothetical protein